MGKRGQSQTNDNGNGHPFYHDGYGHYQPPYMNAGYHPNQPRGRGRGNHLPSMSSNDNNAFHQNSSSGNSAISLIFFGLFLFEVISSFFFYWVLVYSFFFVVFLHDFRLKKKNLE